MRSPPAILLFAALCLAAGCLSSGPTAENVYERAEAAFQAGNYRTAEDLYEAARNASVASGDSDLALAAKRGMIRARYSHREYPYNRSAAEAAMREKIPAISDAEIDAWLDTRAQTLVSDNETLYFDATAANYLYAHPAILRNMDAGVLDIDRMGRYAWADDRDGGHDTDPVRYTGSGRLEIAGDLLPESGTIRIWFPLPVETASQRNISVSSLSCPEYVKTGPVTTGTIGYLYCEIPAEAIDGDLLVSVDIAFTSYEQVCTIDPARVGEYNTSDPLYRAYTRSERNIEITPGITALAREIVGDETSPAIRARMIYDYIIGTYPYSRVPHSSLDLREPKVAESTYMWETGHGDCGTQSMFFSALCRALGIPARPIGGYQMILSPQPGPHFWAEYFLPGYGWVPCDPTVAETADWVRISAEDRTRFKDYYASSLDPDRYVIQTGVDVPMDPPIPGDAVVFRLVRQYPAVVAPTADRDLNIAAMEGFTVDLSPAG